MSRDREPAAVRPATAADAGSLAALGERTFRETFVEDFGVPYSEADVAEFVPSAFSADAFRRRIADPAYSVWIAEQNGRAVGFASAGPCGLPHEDVTPACGELKQIYVAREAQGTGVGRALLDVALAWLERQGPRRLWIGVWSGNDRARAVYAARGFQKVGEYGFRVGVTVDREFILRRG